MKRLFISVFILMASAIFCNSCVSTRKNHSSLESLMIQENTRLRINREFYSRHNTKARKAASRKYSKYGRR